MFFFLYFFPRKLGLVFETHLHDFFPRKLGLVFETHLHDFFPENWAWYLRHILHEKSNAIFWNNLPELSNLIFYKKTNKESQVTIFQNIVCCKLTLVLLNPDISCFANSVDPDQLASEEAN